MLGWRFRTQLSHGTVPFGVGESRVHRRLSYAPCGSVDEPLGWAEPLSMSRPNAPREPPADKGRDPRLIDPEPLCRCHLSRAPSGDLVDLPGEFALLPQRSSTERSHPAPSGVRSTSIPCAFRSRSSPRGNRHHRRATRRALTPVTHGDTRGESSRSSVARNVGCASRRAAAPGLRPS